MSLCHVLTSFVSLSVATVGVDDDWDTSRDPDTPDRKRKTTDDRQPESPPEIERKHAPNNWHREKHYRSNHPDPMDTDSPASYPKHLMATGSSDASRYQNGYQDMQVNGKIGTPILACEEGRGVHSGYEAPPYRGSNYHGSNNYYENGHYQGHTPPRSHGHYLPEMDTSPQYGSGTPTSQQDVLMRPRRWACDYCHVATFVSYEEACAHEEACARQYHERYGRPPHQSRGPVPQYDRGQQQQNQGGMGAVYPAGYPMYDARMAGARRDMYQQGGKRMLLAMPNDSESLSDRQCYVRSEMVEIFAATDKDVAARHSKGAQKLVEGQVGIRCVHCSHLRPRDRAERAVCYPSSISRIYQTVADMQRFHFEQCREIPMEIRKIYKTLKTTRPRGVGSPQTYWVQSAKTLDLIDSKQGIRFGADVAKEEAQQQQQQEQPQVAATHQDEEQQENAEQQQPEELVVKEEMHEPPAEQQHPEEPLSEQ
ncbi:MAG: hypothetical protein SGARI_000643, partial [Bacillariaceae sp.]